MHYAKTPSNNAWLGEVYGAGNEVGTLGYEDVRIGSISISQQEMSFVNASSSGGDGYSSGLLGLAYPVLGQVGLHITCFNQPALIEA